MTYAQFEDALASFGLTGEMSLDEIRNRLHVIFPRLKWYQWGQRRHRQHCIQWIGVNLRTMGVEIVYAERLEGV